MVTDAVVANAALLSAVEIGLGSFLHAFHVPMAGHFLSLNQGLLLSRAALAQRSRALPLEASNVSAVLKSLSPAGKKLTPMLAISAQGAWLSLGLGLFGLNPVGLSVGMVLLGLWAFAQPLAIAYLLFGHTLVEATQALFQGLEKSFGLSVELTWTLVAAVVGLKVLFSLAVVAAAYAVPETSFEKYLSTLLRLRKDKPLAPPAEKRHPALLALEDLANPLFLFSLGLTLAFFVWADSPKSVVLWGLFRPLAGGFLLFFLFRAVPFERLFRRESTVHRTLSALRQM